MIVKKHQSEREIERENYWVSYSDLMAGLFFLFLIILTSFAYQFKREQMSLIAAKKELQIPAITRDQILQDLQKHLKDAGLDVQVVPDRGILRLSDKTLRFPPAKAVPEPDTIENLSKLAKAMTAILPCYSTVKGEMKANPKTSEDESMNWCPNVGNTQAYQCNKNFTGTIETIMIEGHTDSTVVRETAGYRDNLALSAARATTVLRLMKSCDSNLEALHNQQGLPLFAASGYSDLRPLIDNDTKDARNRRIDIRIIMDLPEVAMSEKQKDNKTL